MTKLGFGLVLALAGTVATVTPPAKGQTLNERIQEVRKQRAQQEASRSPKMKLLQALMHTRLTVRFDDATARDVFEYVRTASGINIIARFSDDPVGHGIDPETPITLDAQRMRTVDLLELVLEQCAVVEECTWQLRRGFVEVGTKERLAAPSARELRVYPIDDLLYEPPAFRDAPPIGIVNVAPPYGDWSYTPRFYVPDPFNPGGHTGSFNTHSLPNDTSINSPEQKRTRAEDLVEMIVDSIEPMAWTINGGEWASIRYRDGSLVVTAPEFIHRQIAGYPRVPPPPSAEPADEGPATPAGS